MAFGFFNFIRFIFVIALSVFVVGCGGGSSDGGDSTSLFINAGADRQVDEQTTVALSAEVQSTSSSLTYSWSVSPLVTIDHPDTSAASASFVAPTLTESATYTFTVRVTDGEGNSASDQAVITVLPVNALPVADINLDAWPELPSNTYPAGVSLTLDASGSLDPDNASSDAITEYTWQQLAGVDVLQGEVTDAETLSFTTPISASAQTLQLRLTVTDNEMAEGSTDITLTIQSASDTVPVVDAGVNHAVFSGESIVLTGSTSSSVPSALPLDSVWRVDSGQTVVIDDSANPQTFAVAPLVSTQTDIVFGLSVTDAFGNTVDDTITVSVQPQPLILLNDTGVTQQASNTVVGSLHQAEFPGQDGQRGQDRIAANGALEKAGQGAAGFDFTPLDENGDPITDSNVDGVCVRDNVTGYIWEVKSPDAGLLNLDNTYSWYRTSNNGGFAGVLSGSDTSCSLTNCNTQDYVNAVNAQGLCGFFDWRMPNHDELLSLMHFGQTAQALIDADYFPNTGAIANGPLWYWTDQSNADGVQGESAQSAWAIDFVSGNDNFLNKQTAARVRLVRAGRP